MTDEPSEGASRDGLAGILFQRSSDGLLLIDPLTERVLHANPVVERLTDFTRAELLEMSLRSIVRHEQPWHDWALPASKDDDGSHEGFLLRTRQADRWVPVRVGMTPIPVGEGQTRVLIRLTDGRVVLALQRRAQKAEAELQRVLNLISDCLWSARVVPGGLAYRYLSPSVQRLTGRPASLFLDRPTKWAERVVPADRPAWQVFRDRLAAGQPGTLDYRILHADGRQVRVRESVLAVPDEGGLVLYGVLCEVPETPKEDLPRPSFSHESFERVLGAVSATTAPVSEQPLVLVVDDDAAILDVASRLLTSAGCRVIPARNGVDAVALYKQHAAEIRFVLLDLSLPRLSGDRVAAELRRLDAALPIALMSGHHDLESRPELADLGLAGCVQKPFRMAEILALLERVLGLQAKR